MIKTFKHKGLRLFYETGNTQGIPSIYADRLRLILFQLNNSKAPRDMRSACWKLHKLSGNLKNYWAVWVSGNWRIIFKFDEQDVIDVNLIDYH